MIVQNRAKDDRDDCCFCIFDCHISVTGDLALSEKKPSVTVSLCFVRARHEGDFRGHQIVTGERSLYDMSNSKDIIAGPGYTGLQKISISFLLTLKPPLCKSKKKKTENEAGLVCKNRQKRQIT